MRIGIVESGLPPVKVGGAEVQAWELARRLARSHKVTVFTKRLGDVPAEETVEDVRIVRTRVAVYPFTLPLHILASVRAIRRIAKDLDVLLCFRTTPGGVIGRWVKQRTGLPFCVSIRGGDWYFVQPTWWGKRLLRRVFWNADAVVAQADSIGKAVHESYAHVQPVTIPNGVESDDRQAGGDAVLFLGNLLRRKGVHVLLEAMKELPDIPLVVAGDGPERKTLEQQARGTKTEFLGRIRPDDVKQLMLERGRVLVLPAISGEGFPNVLTEAMSVGLPVIASDVAGIRDMLDDGRAGRVVAPGVVPALAAAIRDLWQDAAVRMALADAGRKNVERFQWPRVVAQWVSVLADCAGRRSPR